MARSLTCVAGCVCVCGGGCLNGTPAPHPLHRPYPRATARPGSPRVARRLPRAGRAGAAGGPGGPRPFPYRCSGRRQPPAGPPATGAGPSVRPDPARPRSARGSPAYPAEPAGGARGLRLPREVTSAGKGKGGRRVPTARPRGAGAAGTGLRRTAHAPRPPTVRARTGAWRVGRRRRSRSGRLTPPLAARAPRRATPLLPLPPAAPRRPLGRPPRAGSGECGSRRLPPPLRACRRRRGAAGPPAEGRRALFAAPGPARPAPPSSPSGPGPAAPCRRSRCSTSSSARRTRPSGGGCWCPPSRR